MKKRKFSLIVKEVEQSTGVPWCAWKGRMGPWWASEGLQGMLREIRTLMTDELRAALNTITDAAAKSKALQMLDSFRESLGEALWDKMKFWLHIPYRLLGVFACCAPFKLPLVAAKLILKECVAEYDRAVRDGGVKSVHRVAHRILDPLRRAGRELREWLEDASGKTLVDYVHAFLMLQEYALCPLTERRVESIHAILKRYLRRATLILPPMLSAMVREEANLELLETDRVFYDFCVAEWRQTSLLKRTLALVTDEQTLKAMSTKKKLETVYQCSLACEYMNTDEARQQQARFDDQQNHYRPAPTNQPEDTKQCVKFVKTIFRQGEYYALPEANMQQWKDASNLTEAELPGSYSEPILELAQGQILEPPIGSVRIFRVLSTTPENRFRICIPHLARSRNTIIVSECLIVAADPSGRKLVNRLNRKLL